jgi:gamma-glutamyltranspeptidase/glutathione hydrolase
MAGFRLEVLRAHPAAAAVFLKDGEVPPLGHRVRQPALARTLEALAAQGHDGFYRGELAAELVREVRAAGGIWSREDLEAYAVVEREPLRGRYRGWTVTSAAPPSSGGVALLSMLNILGGYELAGMDEAARTHLLVEAMRRAYRDRAEYLGDPDFVDMPIERLIHPFYAAGLRAGIRRDRATPSAELPGIAAEPGGHDTTHLSILDREGNYVAATLSINYPFGSGFVAAGSGLLLNDEMDDFSAKPGVANAYGLVGAEANAIAPGKRMLSSMSPTFVSGPDGVAVLGTPGGSRIISMLLLGILEVVAGEGPKQWVARPRIHHQYLPDTLFFEPGALTPATIEELERRGHSVQALERPYGNMQALWWDRRRGEVAAASDPRGEGAAEVR